MQGAAVWASPAGLLPVLGDGGVGLCRAVKRDHVVLQHGLWLYRQVDKRGVCGEKRRPCRWGAARTGWGFNPRENMRVKASDPTTWDRRSSRSPGGPQKVGGLGRGLPPSLEVPDSGRLAVGSGLLLWIQGRCLNEWPARKQGCLGLRMYCPPSSFGRTNHCRKERWEEGVQGPEGVVDTKPL